MNAQSHRKRGAKNAGAPSPGARSPRRAVLVLACATLLVPALLTGVVGCGSSSGLSVMNQPFNAAPARLTPVNDRWQVVFTAPTGGWRARFDTTRRMFDGWEVFVTIITPRADAVVTEAQTELHVLTPVSAGESISVYARTTPDENPDENPPGLFHWLFGWLLPVDTGPAYQPAAEKPHKD